MCRFSKCSILKSGHRKIRIQLLSINISKVPKKNQVLMSRKLVNIKVQISISNLKPRANTIIQVQMPNQCTNSTIQVRIPNQNWNPRLSTLSSNRKPQTLKPQILNSNRKPHTLKPRLKPQTRDSELNPRPNLRLQKLLALVEVASFFRSC
jgi:hypothetical protein